MCLLAGVDLLVDQPLTVETLSSLVELTRFETLTPRFSATVPPCWVEVQQEQQQRRHPQHLHQQHHGDAAQHTRTWKLQSDRCAFTNNLHSYSIHLPSKYLYDLKTHDYAFMKACVVKFRHTNMYFYNSYFWASNLFGSDVFPAMCCSTNIPHTYMHKI